MAQNCPRPFFNVSNSRDYFPLQVDNTNLAEIDGGEVAITNLLSCNGPVFTIKLHFSFRSPGTRHMYYFFLSLYIYNGTLAVN